MLHVDTLTCEESVCALKILPLSSLTGPYAETMKYSPDTHMTI